MIPLLFFMKNSIDVFADKKAWEADFRCKYLIGIGLVFVGFCSVRSGVVYVFLRTDFLSGKRIC